MPEVDPGTRADAIPTLLAAHDLPAHEPIEPAGGGTVNACFSVAEHCVVRINVRGRAIPKLANAGLRPSGRRRPPPACPMVARS